MELFAGLSVSLLVYTGFAFCVAAYLARDELKWRLLSMCGSVFYLSYYYLVADVPIWGAIITNCALASVNLFMTGVVIHERSTWGMRPETLAIYRRFPMLSPGHFRRLMKAADHVVADGPRVLVTAGQVPERLYFVLHGTLELQKGGSVARIEPGVFIAEIAFLTGRGASATVTVGEGAEYLQWDAARLRRMLERSAGLRAAVVANLNLDLAQKVAGSHPIAPPLSHIQAGAITNP